MGKDLRFKRKLTLLIVGIIIGITTVVVAETTIDSSTLLYSHATDSSKPTVKDALDDIYTKAKADTTHCPSGYKCTVKVMTGASMLISKASANPNGTLYADSTQQGEMFEFVHTAYSSRVQRPNEHKDYRYIGGRYCAYDHDGYIEANADGTCPKAYYVFASSTSGGTYSHPYDVRKTCPTNTSYTTYTCEEMTATGIYGTEPNNYIDYNGETWRILGVFPTDDGTGNIENRIKIIRNDTLATVMAWNNPENSEWAGGSLDNYLNGDTSGNYYYSLSGDAKAQIDNAVYYLGISRSVGSASHWYDAELGSKISTGTTNKNVVRKVGLMYISDWMYTFDKGIDQECVANQQSCVFYKGGAPRKSWLHQYKDRWLQNPSYDSGYVNYLNRDSGDEYGFVGGISSKYKNYIQPTVYLKASVELSGTGTKNDHYRITKW